MDGTLVLTTGECKAGMDISYKGTWGYHPLLVSLAETGEVLCLVNRSGNRPSHEGAAAEADEAIALCRRGGFRNIVLRGDTAFSQSEKLDTWDRDGVTFYFGFKALPNLKEIANNLEPQVLVGTVAARDRTLAQQARGRKGSDSWDGIQDLPQRLHQDSLPDHPHWSAIDLPCA